MITIAYMTNRKNPRIRWFFDSLHRECGDDYSGIKLVVVDFYAQKGHKWGTTQIVNRKAEFKKMAHCDIVHVPPKPTVWQGPHRLTNQDWFAASNARNTALCYAEGEYLVCVDDLSVLLPGWLNWLNFAIERKWIACGAYKKMLNLDVRVGEITNAEEYPEGVDSRLSHFNNKAPTRVTGNSAFGCSFGAPIEALLKINGWDEDNDSMAGEDYCCGMMLEQQGYMLYYVPGMMTYESEEAHHEETPFKRVIKPYQGSVDASHRMLNWVKEGRRPKGHNYDGFDLRELRERILAGENFPVTQVPEHDWRDGQPLSEM